jgi:predicted MFS family arabinose efflux permease
VSSRHRPHRLLTDRYQRSRLLWVSIAFWAVAQAAGGLAPTFAILLVTRVALGR